ncbi:complexin-3-like [Pseudoliparis swirei]|uniref:complexin-3-like n=1 Tax=Pseudoliparis swirei TaxID=2059687 RepID=UPI0024BE0807|nr:complexin-3-like [Pseudoliparis swirei]
MVKKALLWISSPEDLAEATLQGSTSSRSLVMLLKQRQEREANFVQKKAERATVRSHFRDKYRLPKNETDETQIQQAGDDVVLPTELAKMIAEDNQEESHKQSVLGQLSNIQNVDIDQLKDKAQATLEDLKKQTENCSLM